LPRLPDLHRAGAAKMNRAMLAGTLHVCTALMSLLVSRMFMSHCPQCTHLLGRHQRRADGSFRG
jgi:hypothetical protein